MTALSDYKSRKFGKAFTLFDRDGDGVVRRADMESVVRKEVQRSGADYEAPEMRPVRVLVERWWRTLDPEGRGEVDHDGFVTALVALSDDRDAVRHVFEDGVRCLLSRMDRDGDGRVSKAEFVWVTQEDGLTSAERDAAFDRMDRDGDGYADVEDLVADYVELYCTSDPDAACNGIAGFL
ncbi:Ca2+-binding protein, EF-hand superfamily [Streptoalloteichus tenebrarius]|uniref:Ca2+-binding protein, EF-hand superfamily n=1 Tax=Streptoalloteichus tenebrarius (strain ATCC 17920 / DSM 40477 / JCM 4838 / CBS 697.72 / NBRC 16177 / NCIMB 11028 / NRRL B-12390 / A12253. 1 / ISP 5477) TaxID=1933 RepID=A0ABT1HMD6_STRSD|nr:EF-hand domain-containing protein [Streptoalloteichus tenebrarius]MCP2256672.1 Ca2+-binding protein, EF-hand superfamily [Streptoalloteichus tenebrarius]BFF05027.1 hypothetical protein GCM10020241_67020 [Streptoalloteichus tenebrarius]